MADTNIRQRKVNNNPGSVERDNDTPARTESRNSLGISAFDILRAIIGVFLLNFLLSYFITGDSFLWGYKPWWSRWDVVQRKLFTSPIVLTDSELLSYDGRDQSKPIYVAVDGIVYDVSAARHIYGPGGSYNFFAGHDASRAYITGCFEEDSVPDIRGAEWTYVPRDVPRYTEKLDEDLDEQQREYRNAMLRKAQDQVADTLKGWQKVFRGDSGKKYFEVGYLRREPKWMESLPLRTLCKVAEKQRPKPKHKKADPGKSYRKSS